MKTILVIYSNSPVEDTTTLKRYPFNTASPVKVGDRVKLPAYDTPIQVVEIMPKQYSHVNKLTGELSSAKARPANTNVVPIRVIEVEPPAVKASRRFTGNLL
jgi:hypothetical protein